MTPDVYRMIQNAAPRRARVGRYIRAALFVLAVCMLAGGFVFGTLAFVYGADRSTVSAFVIIVSVGAILACATKRAME